ncbi:hypothetical protein Tco_0260282 [Tanacetum coccineum]
MGYFKAESGSVRVLNMEYRTLPEDCPKSRNINLLGTKKEFLRGKAYILGGGDANPGSNTVTGSDAVERCMQTRSSSKFVGEPFTNPTCTNPKRRNRRRSKQRVEPFALEETPVVTMADQRTMAELLCAPTEGYAEAIVVPPIPAEHFELKHSLINLVTSKQFFGFEKEDPHAHIRYFNKITSTLKYKDVPETSI